MAHASAWIGVTRLRLAPTGEGQAAGGRETVRAGKYLYLRGLPRWTAETKA